MFICTVTITIPTDREAEMYAFTLSAPEAPGLSRGE
jgi:hypothetical protein